MYRNYRNYIRYCCFKKLCFSVTFYKDGKSSLESLKLSPKTVF